MKSSARNCYFDAGTTAANPLDDKAASVVLVDLGAGGIFSSPELLTIRSCTDFGFCDARPVHILAIRRNCDRRSGLGLLFANSLKSDARRRHSRSCFRVYSKSGIVHHLEQPMSNHCTASVDLSVVYATDGTSSPSKSAPTISRTQGMFPYKNSTLEFRMSRRVQALCLEGAVADFASSPRPPGMLARRRGRD